MSGYLANLLTRTFEPATAIQPRLAPLFGPPNPNVGTRLPTDVEENVEVQTVTNTRKARISEAPSPLAEPPAPYRVDSSEVSDKAEVRYADVFGGILSRSLSTVPAALISGREVEGKVSGRNDVLVKDKATLSFTGEPMRPAFLDMDSGADQAQDTSPFVTKDSPEITVVRDNASARERMFVASSVAEAQPKSNDSTIPESEIPADKQLAPMETTLLVDIERYYSDSRPQPAPSNKLSYGPQSSDTKDLAVPRVIANNKDADASQSIATSREVRQSFFQPPQGDTTIEVTIGRVEIKAEVMPQPARSSRPVSSVPSLDEYLRRRSGRNDA